MMPFSLILAMTIAAPPGFEGTLIKVVDGDTVRVQPTGERKWRTIRLIGVDAPTKATRDVDGQEPWGTRAQQFLSLKATRKAVHIEYDVLRPADPEDPMIEWGYVWLGDELLNEVMLRQGHALLITDTPNVRYVDRLRAAAKSARDEQLGIHDRAEPLPKTPAEFDRERLAAVAEPAPMNTLMEWREGCAIGNRKSKIFHIPGGRYYDGMKMSRDAVFFATPADAERAGYKKSSR